MLLTVRDDVISVISIITISHIVTFLLQWYFASSQTPSCKLTNTPSIWRSCAHKCKQILSTSVDPLMESLSGFQGIVLICYELVFSLFIYFTLCFAHLDDRNVMYLKCNLMVIVIKVLIICQKGVVYWWRIIYVTTLLLYISEK